MPAPPATAARPKKVANNGPADPEDSQEAEAKAEETEEPEDDLVLSSSERGDLSLDEDLGQDGDDAGVVLPKQCVQAMAQVLEPAGGMAKEAGVGPTK